jgi:hypothetical protein
MSRVLNNLAFCAKFPGASPPSVLLGCGSELSGHQMSPCCCHGTPRSVACACVVNKQRPPCQPVACTPCLTARPATGISAMGHVPSAIASAMGRCGATLCQCTVINLTCWQCVMACGYVCRRLTTMFAVKMDIVYCGTLVTLCDALPNGCVVLCSSFHTE